MFSLAKCAWQSFERALAAAAPSALPRINAEITCALAQISFISGDVARCRQLLLAAAAVPALCVHAVFALCALGLLLSDGALSLAALGTSVVSPALSSISCQASVLSILLQHMHSYEDAIRTTNFLFIL